jgi:transcriptional regulator with XRE-family HTH domain
LKHASLHSPEHKALIGLLRELRDGKGLTQAEAAKSMSRWQGYVSDVETGERGLDYLQLREFCAAYEIDPIEFVVALEKRLKALSNTKPIRKRAGVNKPQS